MLNVMVDILLFLESRQPRGRRWSLLILRKRDRHKADAVDGTRCVECKCTNASWQQHNRFAAQKQRHSNHAHAAD